jgi:glutaredoxin-like YruB-family protein
MLTTRRILTLAVLLLAYSFAGAEIYPRLPPSQPLTSSNSEQPTPAPVLLAAAAKQERFSGTVELYVTSWCGYCKKALEYVKSHNIKYVAYDIEKDAAAKQRYKEMGGHGVPFIVIGKNTMSGYSQQNLEHYLNNPGK